MNDVQMERQQIQGVKTNDHSNGIDIYFRTEPPAFGLVQVGRATAE
jgi:hypothetical protein